MAKQNIFNLEQYKLNYNNYMAWKHLIRPVLLGEGAWRIAIGVGKGIAAIHSACTPEVMLLFHHIEDLHELWNALATRFNTQNSGMHAP